MSRAEKLQRRIREAQRPGRYDPGLGATVGLLVVLLLITLPFWIYILLLALGEVR